MSRNTFHDLHKTQNIAESGSIIALAVLMQLRYRTGGAVRAEHCGHAAAVHIRGAVIDNAREHDKRHSLCTGASGDASYDLTLKALRIELSLTGNDHVGAFKHIVKTHRVEDSVNARTQSAS